MPYGISIHIGINETSLIHYGSTNELEGCINDAKDMLAIATEKGFDESHLMIDKEASYSKVVERFKKAARKLKKDDILFITYSGHGASVWDNNRDEDDGKDETWCLYDRMILDDELAQCWARFKAGVRILMISDSCHSGSVSRVMNMDGEIVEEKTEGLTRGIDDGIEVYEKNKAVYDKTVPADKNIAKGTSIKATVLLLSGCQDNQTSRDGKRNGLFTSKLRRVYDDGKFTGNYAGLLLKVLKLMPSDQTPNYSIVGKRNAAFERAKPFEK